MKKSAKWIIGLAAAFFACIIIGSILLFTALNVTDIKSDVLDNNGVIFNKRVVKEINEEKKIELSDDINLIDLEIGFGNVKIEKNDDDVFMASIKGKIYNLSLPSRDYKFDLFKEGKTLKFIMQEGWTFLGTKFFKGDIILQVPSSFDGDFNLKIGSGDVDFLIDNEFNSFNLKVSSGNIDVDSIKCKTTSGITVSSGEITIKKLEAKETSISVSSGNIDIDSIKCQATSGITISSGKLTINKLEAKEANIGVSSGNLTISDCEIEKNLKVKTSSGNINLKGNFETLDAEVSSGTIDIEAKKLAGNYKVKISSGLFKLKLPENASYELSGRVSSGNLKNNKTGSRYSDGNISANVNGGLYNIEFNISSGDAIIN